MNIDVEAGLTNGAVGVVTKCYEKCITAEFGNITATLGYTSFKNPTKMRFFKQIPVRLFYGVTAHKVQVYALCK